MNPGAEMEPPFRRGGKIFSRRSTKNMATVPSVVPAGCNLGELVLSDKISAGTSAILQEQAHGTSAILQDSCHSNAAILQNTTAGTSAVLQNTSQGTTAVLQENCHNTSALLQEQSRGAASIVAANERLALSQMDRAERHGLTLRDSIERGNCTTQDRVDRDAFFVNGELQRNAFEIREAQRSLLIGQKDNEIRTLQTKCSLQKAVGRGFQDTRLDIANSKECVTKTMLENFAAVQLEAAKNYAAIQLDACRNKEALARQMAEGFCCLKDRVTETANTTQQLVRELDTNRIRDSLATANTNNLILQMRLLPLPVTTPAV